MILQLRPHIEVITPMGKGKALFFIDHGIHRSKYWIVSLAGGKIKRFDIEQIRVILTDVK